MNEFYFYSQFCQNLHTFETYYSEKIVSKEELKFKKLERFVVYSTELSSCVSKDVLLSNPRIKHLNISSASTLDSNSLANIIDNDKLNFLTELTIMSAPLLDIESAEICITNLSNLRFLGKLDGWNVTKDSVELLRKKVKEENYDVKLWYNGSMQLELNLNDDFLNF